MPLTAKKQFHLNLRRVDPGSVQYVNSDTESIDVRLEALKPAATPEEFELHIDALEWSLADPIIIESIDDLKSRTEWRDGFAPFEHQVRNLITFCRCLPVTLLADDVGLGKTISAGLIVSELMKRRRVSRVLVLCPNILRPQWVEELESKLGIMGRTAVGGALDFEFRSDASVVVTTYESATPRLVNLRGGTFDMLILDEAHKLRNLYGTGKPPRRAVEIRRCLEQRHFKYVLMLTATPLHNRLWDLYSLVDCLTVAKGHKNPLGSTGEFTAQYIADGTAARQLRPGSKQSFRGILREYVVRTRRQDAKLAFPDREVDLSRVAPKPLDMQLQEIVAEHISGLNGLQQTSILLALMSSPEALLAQVKNMADRDPYWQPFLKQIENALAISSDTAKPAGLLDIVKHLRAKRPTDWRLVVFTIRKETQKAIGRLLQSQGVQFGFITGGQPGENTNTIRKFMADPPEISVIVSTDAGAEGVNLQRGNVVVNYDLPWNPMIVEQRIGRVQRLASMYKSVVVLNLCVTNGPEERVVARLMEKLQLISETVGDIESILESTYENSADAGASFEKQVRELVIKSLKGQDVEQATRKAEESLQRGKILLEERAHEIDQTLGRLDALHDMGPPAPKLTRPEPRTPYCDFVMRAIAARGGVAHELKDNLWMAVYQDRPDDSFTFDERVWSTHSYDGAFMGITPKLYLPGKPDFERLVQHWVDHAGHCVNDHALDLPELTRKLAIQWLKQFEGTDLTDARFAIQEARFEGEVLVRASATNAVDSYEKIIRLKLSGPSKSGTTSTSRRTSNYIPTNLTPERLIQGVESAAREGIRQDSDIQRFQEFYQLRLQEELARSGDSARATQKLCNDFYPRIHGDVVGMHGDLHAAGVISVDFTVDGQGSYSAELTGSPSRGTIDDQPPVSKCTETGRQVPDTCLDECRVTGQSVLAHLLTRSEESGILGLARLAVSCPVSGKRVFAIDLGRCEVSDQMVCRSLLQQSAISERYGLADRLKACEFTGVTILPDELRRSEVSGRWYRGDEGATSAVSGQTGHRSEFTVCEITGALILPEEGLASSLSGRRIRADQICHSEKNPKRFGSSDEIVTCQVTGKRLLADEAARCAVSGKFVDRDLLVTSAVSDARALPDLLVTCEHSGQQVLPAEMAISDVSGKRVIATLLYCSPTSGRHGLPEECRDCEFTGTQVLRDELLTSDVSAKLFRSDEVVTSDLSGRIGHRCESLECEYSGDTLLTDEAARSDVTGKMVVAKELMASEKSGRRGVASANEIVACEVSGKKLLIDECQRCEVTGKLVDQDLLIRSVESGRMALPDAMVVCEQSGERILPDEVEPSDVSGKHVRRGLLKQSAISDRRGTAGEFGQCEFTREEVLLDELEVSAVSGRKFRRDQRGTSQLSNRVGHASEVVHCVYTHQSLLLDEAGKSDLTGKPAAKGTLVRSGKTGRLGVKLAGEVVECELTRLTLLVDEAVRCAATNKLVDPSLLAPSAESGQLALPDAMAVCEITGDHVLPLELGTSDVSGTHVRQSLLRKSPISDRQGLESEFERCDFTQVEVLNDELVTSDYSGKRCRQDEVVRSAVSQRAAHVSECLNCSYSHRSILPDEVGHSAVSGKLAANDLLVASAKTGRLGVESAGEVAICQVTGQKLLSDEMAICEVTGQLVDCDLLAPSAESGRLGLKSELVTCECSGELVLPDELVKSNVSGRKIRKGLVQCSEASGRSGTPDEVRRCQMTDSRVLSDELVTSDVSGKEFRSDQSARSEATGRVGHQSETVTCQYTGQTILRDEVDKSDVTHWITYKGNIGLSEKSERKGHLSECTKCTLTGKQLLTDEVGRSAVTGRVVDKEFLVPSNCSGQVALESEMVRCAESGALLLPAEVAKCGIRNELVDRRLLRASDMSGKPGIARLMATCDATGKIVLPGELARCQITGDKVMIRLLGKCCITGTIAKTACLTASELSGRLVLPDRIVTSALDGKHCARDEVRMCNWLVGWVPKDNSFVCNWTGLSFAKRFYGKDAAFSIFQKLDRGQCSAQGGAHLAPWLESQAGGILRGLDKVMLVESPQKGMYAFLCELRRPWSLRSKVAAFIVTTRGERRVLGRVAFLRRSKQGLQFIEAVNASLPSK